MSGSKHGNIRQESDYITAVNNYVLLSFTINTKNNNLTSYYVQVCRSVSSEMLLNYSLRQQEVLESV